jgi:hypothetical protein
MANVESSGGRARSIRARQMTSIPPFLVRASSLTRHFSFEFRHFNDLVSIRG